MVYVINEHHRNGNRAKSQWRISTDEEIMSFSESERQGWLVADKGWGLHVVSGQVSWLGVAQDHTTQVFIAKFVGGDANTPWHGYPADYRKNNHDIPDAVVLRKWLEANAMPAAKIRKIARGQPCSP